MPNSFSREQRLRIMLAAEALERRTKAKGKQAGAIGQSGLRVLRTLLFDFCNIPSGKCMPGYKAIQRVTGYALSTIAGALHRLEAAGILTITRRMRWAGWRYLRTSNAYSFALPDLRPEVRPKPPKNQESPRATSVPQGLQALQAVLARVGSKLGFAMP